MTLQELMIAVLNRSDEEINDDEFIDAVAKDGINVGYLTLAKTIDKLSKTFTFTYSKFVPLPDDFFEVNQIWCGEEMLSFNDYRIVNNQLQITNKDYKDAKLSFEMIYYYIPTRLSAPTDVPVTREGLNELIIIYGAYTVLLYKKKYDSANFLLREFNDFIRGGDDGDIQTDLQNGIR
jgi:hypothetical protein